MPLEKSAGAIIFRLQPQDGASQSAGRPRVPTRRPEGGKIYYLLLHYQAGHWDFPKGNIEKGEKMEDTVKREVKEETGIKDIEFIPDFKETIKYFYRLKGKNIFKIVVFFLTETKTEEVKISWEHIGYQWLPYEKAIEQVTFKNAKEILQKANQFLNSKIKSQNEKLQFKIQN